MKHRLWIVLLAALTVGAWAEAGETLALTVHVVTMPPNEEGQDYREEFYVDASGLLVRIRRVSVEAPRDGSPSDYSTVFRWDGHSVEWRGNGETGHASAQDSVVTIDRWGEIQTLQFSFAGAVVGWDSPTRQSSWSAETGFQSGPFNRPQGPQEYGYSTQGARLTEWYNESPNRTVILDKGPHRYGGTLVDSNDVGPGWLTVGSIEVSGRGLWLPDPSVRALLVAILDLPGRLPLWIPFVLEENFLR